jgi:hypothetical protein
LKKKVLSTTLLTASVTAVAANVTQLYQLIIGCDYTCIFMDDKKRKPGFSFIDKNVIAEPTTWSLDGFELTTATYKILLQEQASDFLNLLN